MRAGAFSCPRCGDRVPYRIGPGGACTDCASDDAWTRYSKHPLVIDRDLLDDVWSRREKGRTGSSPYRALLPALPAVLSFVLGTIAVGDTLPLFRPQAVGPLSALHEAVAEPAHRALLFGSLALSFGIVGVIVLRRSRWFRSWALHLVGLLGLTAGGTSAVMGLLSVPAESGWRYLDVPRIAERPTGPVGDVILATAVIVAPDGKGDARSPTVGTGTIIRADADRAWILTCRHVAMPYVAVSSVIGVERAHPVWVTLSDGRGARGRVSWVAPPPLDAAVVVVSISEPPRAIEVWSRAGAISPDNRVFFVPNPLRSGWKWHHGRVVGREPHSTPAGQCSLIFTDLPVQPGDSGTGLFLEDGSLIGLNTWRRDDPVRPLAIGLPSDVAGAILDLLRKGAVEVEEAR